jgi:hypothetical protein
VLAEASQHGFVEGPPKMVVKALLKKCFDEGDVGEVT